MSWKTLMVRMLVLVAMPVGLVMAEAVKEEGKASCPTGKPAGKQAGFGQFIAKKLDLTSEQTEKFQKIFEKHLEAIKAENERFDAEVNTILTPEQQAKFKEMKGNRGPKEKGPEAGATTGTTAAPGAKKGGGFEQALAQLNLPEDKLAKVKEIMKESREKMAAAPQGDRAARMQIRKDMKEKIKAVLSPEEMTKFEQVMKESHPGRPGRGR
jgi:Spy/CpxP family protein refolding chaperone